MKIERLPQLEIARPPLPGVLSDRRLALGLVLSTLVWVLVWYWETAHSMVVTWQGSDTFAHGFLIVPISVWMIWRRRHVLAALELRPWFPALLLVGIAGFAWLVGRAGGVSAVQQFAFVLTIPAVVCALVGRSVVKALAFPFFFLLFAVPFGDFLEPILMVHTADFTIAALRLTGIPVYREGLFFMIPSGSWSVVEACSGLRYLIASLTVGVLYAYLTYRSPVRRAVFIGASLVVPVIGNWVRAYMIVMIGHLTNMTYAVGVDHLIYGWVFFGVLMMVLFWAGSFWREDHEPRAVALAPAPAASHTLLVPILFAAIAAAGLAALWPAAASRLEDGQISPVVLEAPGAAGGWQPVAEPLTDWTPRLYTAHTTVNQTYRREDLRGGIVVGYYPGYRPGGQLISSKDPVISSYSRAWKKAGEGYRSLSIDGGEIPLIETRLRGVSTSLLVWRCYWLDGQYVANRYWAKFLQAKSRLLGRGGDGVVVLLYAPYDDGRQQSAERALRDLAASTLPALTRDLENGRRP